MQPINDVEPGTQFADRTVGELIVEWRKAIKPTLKRSTQSQYDDWAFRKWVLPALGHVPVSELSRADIQRFLTESSGALSGKFVRDLRIALRSLLGAALDWEWLPANPAAGRLRLPEATPRRERRLLTTTQAAQLIASLPEPYATIVVLAMLAGLRKGEIEALRRSDFRGSELVVDETVYRGEIGTPKTTTSRRSVAIGPALSARIEAWREQRLKTAEDAFVFASRNETPIDLHNAIARYIKPACRELKLPVVSWHDLRHTYTTWGRRAGINAETMRDQLGHSSVQITLDVYSHVDDRAEAAAVLERFANLEAT